MPESLSLRELQAFDPRARVNEGESDFCCPLCGEGKPRDSAHRCLSVNVRTGKYQCHRCEAKGVLQERQEPRPQLAPRARRRAALHRAFALPPQEPQEPADPSWKGRLAGLEALAGTPGASYLDARGIPLDVATAAGVRFSSRWYGRPAVVFAFRDADGNLVAAQGRCADGQEPGKLSAGPIGRGVFFGPGAREALDAGEDGATIALVEAPIDALSLAVAGLPALALGGCGGKAWLPRALAFRRVLLAFDADEAGDVAAAKLAAELQALGARCERLRPADAKDWNEALQQGGADALRAAIAGVLARPEEPEACACGGGVWCYGPDGTPYCRTCASAHEGHDGLPCP
ncbi:MAG TPA: toprim domain-containing protein [Vicinamibacterales bacterium]|nr:toprim domain-containing protein [Vicinamibacterales bacterium]